MLDNEMKKAIEAINSRPLTDFYTLDKAKKATKAHYYVCPVCGSGSGKNGTSGLRIYENNRIKCDAAGCFGSKGEDTTGALCMLWDCTPWEVVERTGYAEDTSKIEEGYKIYRERKAKEAAQAEEQKDFSSFYRQCHEALKASPEALDYLHGRGISDESIERFNIGYCATWKHSKGTAYPATRRIIIPRTSRTYTARLMDPPRNEAEETYKKQVEGKQIDLFNLEALEKDPETYINFVWICEGELDAISLYQAGASNVVAIGSLSNIGVIAEKAKEHKNNIYLLALDNDGGITSPGMQAQAKLYDMLTESGIISMNFKPCDIYGEAKDANEAIVKNPKRLKKVIEKAENMANAAYEEKKPQESIGEALFNNFMDEIMDPLSKTYKPIQTGITDIDRALEGGFIRGTLVTLGAPPAMGKTALAQYIFENMARNGQYVLYINLEMSREQLLARSISRLAFLYEEKDISALEVLRGYAWTEEQRKAITRAANIYKQEIAPHFLYNPEGLSNNIDSIIKQIKEFIECDKEKGRPAPIICIDYLQLIDSEEKDATESMKNIIFKLKQLARNENTIVFTIVANNRASNRSGSVDMESGRDTSAIEYSGDIMLGLVYTAIEERRKYNAGEDRNGNTKYLEYDLETINRLRKEAYEKGEAAPAVCNEVTLKVIKSRFTETGRTAKLIFDGKHATYKQVEKQKGAYSAWKRI